MIRWKHLFHALWGAEDDPEVPDPELEAEEEEEEEESSRTLTSKELDAIVGRAVDRSNRKITKDLAKSFGFETAGEMKDWIAKTRQAEIDAMDEGERKVAEAAEKTRSAAALESSLASDRLDVAVLSAVVSEGVSDKKRQSRIAALVRLDLDPDLVNEDRDSWDEAIADALTSVKEDAPELFTRAKVNHGDGDGGPRGPSEKAKDKAAENEKQLVTRFTEAGLIELPEV